MISNLSDLLSKGRDLKKSPKHDNWSFKRDFTPLDQPREEILEYMLAKEMIKLPRVDDPPIIRGRFKDQFCKFHRAMGHDTEYCFVLRNIIQDYIDKNILLEGKEEDKAANSSAP